jgi:hypothetical protein
LTQVREVSIDATSAEGRVSQDMLLLCVEDPIREPDLSQTDEVGHCFVNDLST